jgi:hypothetical protein
VIETRNTAVCGQSLDVFRAVFPEVIGDPFHPLVGSIE